MATNPPYRLVATRPDWSIEHGSYRRYQNPVILTGPKPITWQWDPRPVSALRVRPWIMDCATRRKWYLSDWFLLEPTATSPAFTVDVPTQDYVAGCDVDADPALALAYEVPFRMQRAAPVVQTHTAVVQDRYSTVYGGPGPGTAILPVPATRPVPVSSPSPLRAPQPHTTFLKADKLWAPFVSCFAGSFMRQFFHATHTVAGVKTRVLTTHANRQQYYDESVRNRELPIIDGPRGVGTDGLALALYPRAYSLGDAHAHTPKLGQSWWSATPHAAREKWEDGSIVTMFGERLKDGEFAYYWNQSDPQSPDYDPELLASKTEIVGNFIDCHNRLEEPWFIGGRPEPNPPGHEDHVQVEHWGWLNNTLRHEVVSFTHFTAHGAGHYVKSAWMPNDYVAPDEPTGQTDIVHLFGNRDGTPQGRLVNNPWGGADLYLNTTLPDHETYRDLVVFGNKFGASLVWGNLKTKAVTPLHLSPVLLPPSAQEINTGLKIWDRAAMRALYPQPSLTEWFPLADLVLIRPSALDMFSDGNLCLADDATGWIFDIDVRARRARICYTYTRGKAIWIWLSVNWRGDTGPLDCIRITGWKAGGDQTITRQGVVLGQAVPGSSTGNLTTLQGPGHYAGATGYGAANAMRNGYVACSDGGHYKFHVRVPRLATDPVLDAARYKRGLDAWNLGTEPSLALTHGPSGQGRYGLPTCFEMATWDDARLDGYLVAQGLSAPQAADVRYMTRWNMAGSPPVEELEMPKTIHVEAHILTVPAGEYRTRVQLLDDDGTVVAENVSDPTTVVADPPSTPEVQEPINTVSE